MKKKDKRDAYRWSILHPASGRADGHYSLFEDAEEILAYFQEEAPNDLFVLVGSRPDVVLDMVSRRGNELRAIDSHQWAVGAANAQ